MDSQRNEIRFNFYGIGIVVECLEVELCQRLERDFSYFKLSTPEGSKKEIRIQSSLDSRPELPFPLLIRRFKNRNVEVYEKNGIRVCDYTGDGLAVVNFKENQAKIYANDIHRLHELTYLFILSRVGKELDLLGFHRLHGMAVVRNDILYFGMMPTGGGKTTLLSYLLSEGSYSLYSDDSPLIDRQGRVYPFPIRLGFEAGGKRPLSFNTVYHYELERKEYGIKQLYSFADLKVNIGGEYKQVILFKGEKGHQKPFLKEVGNMSIFPFVFEQGIIGVGLPILIEHFWEFGLLDFYQKTKIFVSRLIGLSRFLIKARVYSFKMGPDIEANVDYFKNNESIN